MNTLHVLSLFTVLTFVADSAVAQSFPALERGEIVRIVAPPYASDLVVSRIMDVGSNSVLLRYPSRDTVRIPFESFVSIDVWRSDRAVRERRVKRGASLGLVVGLVGGLTAGYLASQLPGECETSCTGRAEIMVPAAALGSGLGLRSADSSVSRHQHPAGLQFCEGNRRRSN